MVLIFKWTKRGLRYMQKIEKLKKNFLYKKKTGLATKMRTKIFPQVSCIFDFKKIV